MDACLPYYRTNIIIVLIIIHLVLYILCTRLPLYGGSSTASRLTPSLHSEPNNSPTLETIIKISKTMMVMTVAAEFIHPVQSCGNALPLDSDCETLIAVCSQSAKNVLWCPVRLSIHLPIYIQMLLFPRRREIRFACGFKSLSCRLFSRLLFPSILSATILLLWLCTLARHLHTRSTGQSRRRGMELNTSSSLVCPEYALMISC